MGLSGACSALLVGAASTDITPDEPSRVYLAGFGPNRRATGVRDPIEANVIYLKRGRTEVVLVAVDVVGLQRRSVEQIRQLIEARCQLDGVIVCATHTHSGPDTMGMWGWAPFGVFPLRSGRDRTACDRMFESIAEAVERAMAGARAARLRAAVTTVPEQWIRNERNGGARYDEALAVGFDDANGERIATLLNVACHPETLWENNTHISSDFPGAFRRRVRQEVGGVAAFFPGALGGMLTPDVPRNATTSERAAFADRMGEALAERALDALKDAPLDASPSVVWSRRNVSLHNDNWKLGLLARLGLLDVHRIGSTVQAEVHQLRVGNVRFYGFPGEPVPEIGHRVREMDRLRFTGIMSLCCDELGYILTRDMFADAEYGYEQSMSLGPSSADALLDAHERMLGET